MNKNTIEFKEFKLDIPKISKEQYVLLRHILMSIEKNSNVNNSYCITSGIIPHMTFIELIELLKTNIKLSIMYTNKNEWYGTDVINDISIVDGKIFFRPATILVEIVQNSKNSKKHAYLKYILFNGIRYKQTLLFLDYMLNLDKNIFTVEVDMLKKILELENQYKNYNAFKGSVIDKIIEDINTKTNFHISFVTEKKKNGRKIISLTFDYYNMELNRD